jgi:hypothetical protein
LQAKPATQQDVEMEKGKAAADNIEVPEKSTRNRWLEAFNCISRIKDKM